MKQPPHLLLYSKQLQLKPILFETLESFYPELVLTQSYTETDLIAPKAKLCIIDTLHLSIEQTHELLELLPDIPALLLIQNLDEAKHYAQIIRGRRELITINELGNISLINVVRHLFERQELHKEVQKNKLQLHELSTRDEETKLYNRRHFCSLLDQEIKKSNRYQRELSLVLLEFKKNEENINEDEKHSFSSLTTLIQNTLRGTDLLSRLDENIFAFLLPETDAHQAHVVCERLQEQFDEHFFSETWLCSFCHISKTKNEIFAEALIEKNMKALFLKRDERIINANQQLHLPENNNIHLTLKEPIQKTIQSLGRKCEQKYFESIVNTFKLPMKAKKVFLQHAERVSVLAEHLAEQCKLEIHEVQNVRRAGLFHDLGILAINRNILLKKESLSKEEFNEVKLHPLLCSEMLKTHSPFHLDLIAIAAHHERYDGKGYPHGSKQNEIPFAARILNIVEAWDNMVSSQIYRKKPLSISKALHEIKHGAGTQFDPTLVHHFCYMIEQ